jgi:serine/threonine protein kinase
MRSGVKQIDGYKIYLSKLLGKGSYGAVYIGANDNTGEEVAVKILKKSDSKINILHSRLRRIS